MERREQTSLLHAYWLNAQNGTKTAKSEPETGVLAGWACLGAILRYSRINPYRNKSYCDHLKIIQAIKSRLDQSIFKGVLHKCAN